MAVPGTIKARFNTLITAYNISARYEQVVIPVYSGVNTEDVRVLKAYFYTADF
jgi:hypothetical protein